MHRTGLRTLHLVLDATVIAAAALMSHIFARALMGAGGEASGLSHALLLGALALPPWLALIVATGQDRSFERVQPRARLLAAMLVVNSLGLGWLVLVTWMVHGAFAPGPALRFAATSFALMYLQRASIEHWARWQYRRGVGCEQLLLVGAPSEPMAEFVRVAQRGNLPPMLIGHLTPAAPKRDTDRPGEEGDMPASLGSIDDLEQVLHEHIVDRVLFFPPLNHPDGAGPALAHCRTLGVRASLLMHDAGSTAPGACVELEHGRRFATYETAPRSPVALAVKQAIDLCGAAAAVLLLSPLLVTAALAILVTMGRPILFVQARTGLFGRTFAIFKFRTMVRDAESRRDTLTAANEMSGPVFKISADPRVTWLGRLLRKTSIDELPQLFNVLLGDMSLVGPRPLPVAEQQAIRGAARRRLSVKPGITCLWQISGRSNIDFAQWMDLDLRYIDEWSLRGDLHILLMTVPAVLFGRGAR